MTRSAADTVDLAVQQARPLHDLTQDQHAIQYEQPTTPNTPATVPQPNKVGQPAIYTDIEHFQRRIDEYFTWCDSGRTVEIATKHGVHKLMKPRPYTIEGLAYFLGFSKRSSLWDYGQRSSEYADAIEHARIRIAASRMEGGLDRTQEAKIVIFDMINNQEGYKDTRDAGASIEVNVFAGPNTGGDLAKILGPAPVPQLPEKTGDE